MSVTDEPTPNNFVSQIEGYLKEQQELTAVEKFAQHQISTVSPAQEKYYLDLIPATSPKPGEQYAFEVDLDACSGCKACVAACHELNGLEEEEIWRSVGLLHGGSNELPVIQHVTSACHHCLDPGCLNGCPVKAYDKHPDTGIVIHLDDQCIGCQYCILKCPYDVPKYLPEKGIVRKCDMCSDRLSVGEAPACVQSCPTSAIKIKIVNKESIIEESETNYFLPGAPDPEFTLPTTTYKTKRNLPRNMLPADHFTVRPQHSHMSLVLMLVLTQMSVGAFIVDWLMQYWMEEALVKAVRPAQVLGGFLLGVIGMHAAIFHLGRPLYAYRALIGLRKSWLSREILGFSLFAFFAALNAAVAWIPESDLSLSNSAREIFSPLAVLSGIVGIFCSVMIYDDTKRQYWNVYISGMKFFLTSIVLGIPIAILIGIIGVSLSETMTIFQLMEDYGANLCRILVLSNLMKLTFESLIFLRLNDKKLNPLKGTAILLTRELSRVTMLRYIFGFLGGIALPGTILLGSWASEAESFNPTLVSTWMTTILLTSFVGELLERWLFFSAVVAPKMPGTQAS